MRGANSYRYRAAGAQTVAISSRARFAIMTELRERPEPTLGELTAAIKGADLILVEGFKSEKHPKLEVRRLDAMKSDAACVRRSLRSRDCRRFRR